MIEVNVRTVEQRLANANEHFRRKAAEVFGDTHAIRLLSRMYVEINIETAEFNSSQQAVALARLAAAHFCEVGMKSVFITESGQRFIEALLRESGEPDSITDFTGHDSHSNLYVQDGFVVQI